VAQILHYQTLATLLNCSALLFLTSVFSDKDIELQRLIPIVAFAAKMSDGTLFKPEKDYTKEADKIIPEAESLAKVEACRLLTGTLLTSSAERHPERH
jgi:hypothetical protein